MQGQTATPAAKTKISEDDRTGTEVGRDDYLRSIAMAERGVWAKGFQYCGNDGFQYRGNKKSF